jgi:hypothetical protein
MGLVGGSSGMIKNQHLFQPLAKTYFNYVEKILIDLGLTEGCGWF